MKRHASLLFLALIGVFSACEDLEMNFPKRNKRMTKVLGERLVMKTGGDTIALRIRSTQMAHLIVREDNSDTLFYGTVCQYRGLYYFSQALNDTTYWIHAVKITDNLIYGLNRGLEQAYLIDQAIGKGEYAKLLKYQNEKQIRLHPHKKQTRQLFTQLLAQFPADTILSVQPLSVETPLIADNEPDEPEEAEPLVQVYPNPTPDYCTVRLAADGEQAYTLTDWQGKAVLQGVLNSRNNRLDLSQLTNGLYVLTLSSRTHAENQVIKLIKN
jgi:hypothetical protein